MQSSRLRCAVLALGICVAAFLLGTTLAPPSLAQTTVTGALSGTVTDATGAVVPNATVTIENTGTAAKRTVTTDGEGHYTASNLPPGAYTVTASAKRFESQPQGFDVLVGTTTPADVHVNPAGNKTTVGSDCRDRAAARYAERGSCDHVHRTADSGSADARRRRYDGGLYRAGRGGERGRSLWELQLQRAARHFQSVCAQWI